MLTLAGGRDDVILNANLRTLSGGVTGDCWDLVRPVGDAHEYSLASE